MNLYTSASAILLRPNKQREGGTAAQRTAEAHRAHVAAEKARLTLAGLNGNESEKVRTRAETDARDTAEAAREAAIAAKSGITLVPAKGAKLTRYNVSDETFAAWLAAPDADARAAVLADKAYIVTASPVTPSLFAYAGMQAAVAARTPEDATPARTFLSELASGWFALPSVGTGPSKAKDTRTAEEVAEATAEAMFASFTSASA